MKIVGIPGSLRRGSFNRALLEAARERAPDGVELEVASIAGIPLYDADREQADGVPEPVARLKDLLAGADALLLASPEYNASLPGVMKNAVDWCTRPPKDIGRVWGGKPVGLLGATPGRGGTRFAQAAWLPVLHALGAVPWGGKHLYVAGAAGAFDPQGKLVDEAVDALLREYLSAFSEFVTQVRGVRS